MEEDEKQAKSDEQEEADFIVAQRESSKSRTPSRALNPSAKDEPSHTRSASDGPSPVEKHPEPTKSQSAKQA